MIRIEETLNRRFEKDAEMFISKQNVANLKADLRAGNFDEIQGRRIAEHIHVDVLFRTLLRNAWLVEVKNHAKFVKFLIKILPDVTLSYSKKMLQEAAEHKLDLPLQIRIKMMELYIDTLSAPEAEASLAQSEPIGIERIKLLVCKALSAHVGTKAFFEKWIVYKQRYQALNGKTELLKSIPVPSEKIEKHIQLAVDYLEGSANDDRNIIQLLTIIEPSVYKAVEKMAYKYLKEYNHSKNKAKTKFWLKRLQEVIDAQFAKNANDQSPGFIETNIKKMYLDLHNIDSYIAGLLIRDCMCKSGHVEFRKSMHSFLTSVSYHPEFTEQVQQLTDKKQIPFKTVAEFLSELNNTSLYHSKKYPFLVKGFEQIPSFETQAAEVLKRLDLGNEIHVHFLQTYLSQNHSSKKRATLVWSQIMKRAETDPRADTLILAVVKNNAPKYDVVKTYLCNKHFQIYSTLYGM